MDKLRRWAHENEPLLRLIEVLVVVLVGTCAAIWIGSQQLYIANQHTIIGNHQTAIAAQQAKVAQRDLEVSEAELKLVKLQTELARLEYMPRFEFSNVEGEATNYLEAKTDRGVAREIDGTALLVLTWTNEANELRQLALANFYSVGTSAKDDGRLKFLYPASLTRHLEPFLQCSTASGRQAWRKKFNSEPPSPMAHVRLRYGIVPNEELREHFIVEVSGDYVHPTSGPPKCQETLDCDDFRLTGERDGVQFRRMYEYDSEALQKAIYTKMDEMNKKMYGGGPSESL